MASHECAALTNCGQSGSCCAWSTLDTNSLYCGLDDGNVISVDIRNMNIVHSERRHTKRVRKILCNEVNSSSSLLTTAGDDCVILIQNFGTVGVLGSSRFEYSFYLLDLNVMVWWYRMAFHSDNITDLSLSNKMKTKDDNIFYLLSSSSDRSIGITELSF